MNFYMLIVTLIITIIIFIMLLAYKIYLTRKQWLLEIGHRKNNRKEYGYIYFYRGAWEISNLLLVKIGRTNNMKARMSSGSTSNPFGLWILGVVRVKNDVEAEYLIHQKFKKFRINKGKEWFFYPPIAFYIWCVSDKKLKNWKEL